MIDHAISYQAIFEQNLAGIYRTTASGQIILCNPAFASMLGYASPEELLQTDASQLYFTTGTRDAFISDLRATKKLVNYEPVLKRKDGSIFYGIENVSLYVDPQTGEEYLDGIVVDITEREKTEKQLLLSEKRYRQIVETAQEGIWTIDVRDKTNFVNKKMCEMLEYPPAEMMGKELYDFMDEEGKAYAIACMERRRNGAKENLDIRYITKSGKELWCNISSAPIINDDGTYAGALAMVTDVTANKMAAIERERLVADLVQRNKDLLQFNYIVSHNLRAPVANIIGLCNVLSVGHVDDAALLGGIASSAKTLDEIIKDLSFILQVREQVNDKKELVDLKQLVDNICLSIDNIIKEQQVLVQCDFTDMPDFFTIRTYLHSILHNLVINGIKYRRTGIAPVISIKSFAGAGHIALVVEDNGKGIDLLRYGKDIFGLYKRFDTSAEGKGIGLFLVKTQVESLGGMILVESEVNKGTRFIVTLPI